MTTAAAPTPYQPVRGEVGSRLRNPVLIGGFIAALVVVVAAGVVAVKLLAPGQARPACAFGQPCPLPTGVPRALRGSVWMSGFGVQIEYSSDWSTSAKNRGRIELNWEDATMIVTGRRSTDYHGLYNDEVSSLQSKYNLVRSQSPARKVLNPNVGYQPGIGADYCGDESTTQGGVRPIDAIALASTKDGVSTFVAFLSPDCHKTSNDLGSPIGAHELAAADLLLSTLRWPSEIR